MSAFSRMWGSRYSHLFKENAEFVKLLKGMLISTGNWNLIFSEFNILKDFFLL